MRRFSQFYLAFCAVPFLLIVSDVNADVVEETERWLNKYSNSDDSFSLSLIKNKIKFKGCKQKQYQLALNKRIGSMFNVEGIVHYNKGLLDYGVLSQRVKSHEYEVVSWWDSGDYRIGLSHKIRPQHEISLPVADSIQLPTSITSGLYVQFPFNEDSHLLTIGALRESWDSSDASISLPWRSSRDNQVTLQYAITF